MIGTLEEREIARVWVGRVTGETLAQSADDLSIEEPLEIRVGVVQSGRRRLLPLAVTMRTPGNDIELAAGFLFTEGIISERGDLLDIDIEERNRVAVTLKETNPAWLADSLRHSFVSSSCGVCGKRSIAAVQVSRRFRIAPGAPRLSIDLIHGLPEAARSSQTSFSRTGGIHGSALFDSEGRLLSLREDVGRHNALDKLLGAALLDSHLPLAGRIVFVSGRLSFELVQKAAIAGVPVLAAVGAPSSLAVELARECGMTLLGFVRDDRFNVYNDQGRLNAGCRN